MSVCQLMLPFRFSPDLSVRESVPYGSQFGRSHSELPLTKMDGSPLNLMETLPSVSNKVYRYQHTGGEVGTVRRDRPTCGHCRL